MVLAVISVIWLDRTIFRMGAYARLRMVFRGLENYAEDKENEHSFPAPFGDRSKHQSWRVSLLDYVAAREVLERPKIRKAYLSAYVGGRDKCKLFAVIGTNQEWVSNGVNGDTAPVPLFVLIDQHEYDWDALVDVRAATAEETSKSRTVVHLAQAIMFDDMSMVFPTDGRSAYAGPASFVFVTPEK
jgi:hypothetical protein